MTVGVIQNALAQHGLSAGAVQAIDNPDRQLVAEMLKMDRYIDMLIPVAVPACINCAASSPRSR